MGFPCGKGSACCNKGSELKTPDSSSTSSSDSEVASSRGNWGNQAEFLLSTVGYAVGFGNLWRFPYLCFRNGGGAFLIPYVLFLFLCGIPLVFMEMSIGQYAAAGPVGVWALCPLAKGIGIAMTFVSVYCCIYYNIIIMWTVYYFFNSFGKILPWSTCGNDWNTPSCAQFGTRNTTLDQMLCNSTMPMYNSSLCSNGMVKDVEKLPYPAQEFWDRKILARSPGIGHFMELRWDLSLILLFCWILVFLCLIKGIKSSGKVVYVTATAPYILLTILLVQGATMKGSLEGIKFYMKPDFAKLTNPTVWAEACGQIFYSLGAAWGGLITMASYNKFNNNIYRFSITVPLINCATSLYAGFVIFCVIGYMADQAGVAVKDVIDSGPGLVFVVYPYAISNLPVPQLWAVLFFLMILSIGLDSQFAMFETFTTCAFDEFPNVFTTRLRKLTFTGCVCFFCYLAGLFCCTHAGIYFFQLMDWYIGIFTLLFLSILECIIMAWIYGADRMYDNIEMMIGYKPIALWKYMWKFVTPSIIVVMLFYSLVTYKAPIYNSTIPYPPAAIGLAWLYGISSSIPVLAYAAYLLYSTRDEPLTLWQRVLKYTKPSPEWGARKNQQEGSSKYKQGLEESVPLNDMTISNNGKLDAEQSEDEKPLEKV